MAHCAPGAFDGPPGRGATPAEVAALLAGELRPLSTAFLAQLTEVRDELKGARAEVREALGSVEARIESHASLLSQHNARFAELHETDKAQDAQLSTLRDQLQAALARIAILEGRAPPPPPGAAPPGGTPLPDWCSLVLMNLPVLRDEPTTERVLQLLRPMGVTDTQVLRAFRARSGGAAPHIIIRTPSFGAAKGILAAVTRCKMHLPAGVSMTWSVPPTLRDAFKDLRLIANALRTIGAVAVFEPTPMDLKFKMPDAPPGAPFTCWNAAAHLPALQARVAAAHAAAAAREGTAAAAAAAAAAYPTYAAVAAGAARAGGGTKRTAAVAEEPQPDIDDSLRKETPAPHAPPRVEAIPAFVPSASPTLVPRRPAPPSHAAPHAAPLAPTRPPVPAAPAAPTAPMATTPPTAPKTRPAPPAPAAPVAPAAAAPHGTPATPAIRRPEVSPPAGPPEPTAPRAPAVPAAPAAPSGPRAPSAPAAPKAPLISPHRRGQPPTAAALDYALRTISTLAAVTGSQPVDATAPPPTAASAAGASPSPPPARPTDSPSKPPPAKASRKLD